MKSAHWQVGCAVAALVIGLTGGTAVAQQAPAPAEDNLPIPSDPSAQAQSDALVTSADGNQDEIVVTGSRIRRPDFDSPSPIISLGAATVQQSGTTNLTDFLTGFPALQGSSTSADNSGSGAGIGATGLNLLNLRNLGTERSLTLIDGRRQVAGLPGSQAVDVNTIPIDLIERVDVLTGGVSAIYGADAVTGVVNFVLKKTSRVYRPVRRQGSASMATPASV